MGALLIWLYSLVGRSLLIRDREVVLWFKFGYGLFWCSFGGPEVARWWKLNDIWKGVLQMWLGDGDEDWVLFFKGVLLG